MMIFMSTSFSPGVGVEAVKEMRYLFIFILFSVHGPWSVGWY